MRCRCGHAAEVIIRWTERLQSGVGVAFRNERLVACRRCGDKAGFDALARGAEDVRGEPIQQDAEPKPRVRLMVDPREFNRRGFLK